MAGPLLAGGAVLAFLGASVGFGAGVGAGFVLLPMALVMMAVGLMGRVVSATALDPLLVALAATAAGLAIVLAVTSVLQTLPVEAIRSGAAPLLRPLFVGLIVAVVAFGAVGVLVRQLSFVAGALVVVGSALLAGGVFGHERVADIGFWLSIGGWVGLGLLPWGSVRTPADRPPS